MLVSMREKCDNIWRTLTFEMKLLNINIYYIIDWASLVAQRLKRLPAMQETQVRSLGREDPLEKKMSAHSRILAWRIPWTGEPEWATVHGVAKSQTRLSDFTSFHFLHRRQILHHLSSQGSPVYTCINDISLFWFYV